jgi:hypothetical protein
LSISGRFPFAFGAGTLTVAASKTEAGVDPAFTAAQIGHKSSRFTMDVYTDVHNRRASSAAKVGALIRSSDWAEMGRNGDLRDSGSKRPEPESALESA